MKYFRQLTNKEKIFILVHSFGGSNPLSIGIIVFGPVVSTSWWEHVVEQNISPHGLETMRKFGQAGDPKIPFRGMIPMI
jgi:hypothetical protein